MSPPLRSGREFHFSLAFDTRCDGHTSSSGRAARTMMVFGALGGGRHICARRLAAVGVSWPAQANAAAPTRKTERGRASAHVRAADLRQVEQTPAKATESADRASWREAKVDLARGHTQPAPLLPPPPPPLHCAAWASPRGGDLSKLWLQRRCVCAAAAAAAALLPSGTGLLSAVSEAASRADGAHQICKQLARVRIALGARHRRANSNGIGPSG